MPVDLRDYNTVAMRIAEFRHKHPEGCLRPVDPHNPFKIIELDGKSYVCYTAAAYRTPDDTAPGIGVAWEPYPGRTPYTRDSELMNAETSAWGRAIVAVLAADTVAGIATREEIENRQAEQAAEGASKPSSARTPSARKPASAKLAEAVSVFDLATLVEKAKAAETVEQLRAVWMAVGNGGHMQAKIADPETGEKTDFQTYLYRRSDALSGKSSD